MKPMKALDDYDLMSKEFQEESFEFYERLQKEAPVYNMPGTDVYLVSRFDDIKAISLDPATFSNNLSYGMIQGERWKLYQDILESRGWGIKRVLNGADLPEHRRVRKYLDSVLNARNVEALKPRIQEVTDMLIDRFIDRGECDFMREFAFQLPSLIIAEHLGFDPDNIENFLRWATTTSRITNHVLSEEELRECAEAELEMQHYLHEVMEQRKRSPGSDLLSRIVIENSGENVDNQPLTEQELQNVLRDVITGGFGTVINMLGNSLYLLLTHPEQMAKLRANPDLMKNFVEESLRMDTSIAVFPRITTREVEMHGVTIPKGALIGLCLSGANHDPSKFACPHAFDIERQGAGSHITFNFGPHTCPGRLLAKMELQIAFSTILRRIEDIELAEDLPNPHMANWRHRNIERLPIRFRRAR
ncbi:cytochrome P450 [Rhizorhabdus dicambivorans]|uniref:Cytochrome P450 n=1 Tax=Rhizorhabdus dicambivorans TaxID=1850238 RepID=A0A2A4FWC0_9SPHN|nr:cytochrome P450 [Rhizorhabdus dicambivorans]ATE66225.1 cytochrome P450 [Rhizorhabdus dicambivorans]PCE41738.1 cytochrome P450 [Rhizorhabdus dicambivorans]